MNAASHHQRSTASRGSLESELVKTSPARKRKSTGLRGALRKLFGRKSIKSQISLPTPTKPLENDPTSFITSATENRFQRAVSLPLPSQSVSRTSALGSHHPSTFKAQTPPGDPNITGFEMRPGRPRRASLPTVKVNSPEFGALEHFSGPNQYPREAQDTDDDGIGFAVTSGSNPKRRSRSADAFYDSSRSHRMSPIQWRHTRGRSDEIKYWRESVCPTPAFDLPPDGQPVEDELQTPVEGPQPTHDEEESGSHETGNRDTFDFGILASSMQEQERVGVEERVMTLEVKMMDLEYAISKIQKRSPSPAGPTPQNLRPTLQVTRTSPDSTPKPKKHSRRSPAPSDHKTLAGTESSTSASFVTLPTTQSTDDEDMFIDHKPRPTSTATTVRAQGAVRGPSPSPSENRRLQKVNRDSITSLTIEHFTTLIGLIRREQAARIRLEDQVAGLQRQILELQPPPVSPPQSRCRSRGWEDYPTLQVDKESPSYRGARSGTEYDDMSTDDGFYETPTERRADGILMGNLAEGEAF